MSFGEKLTNLRKEKGLNQEELANELGVSRQAVSKWESNNAYPETEKIIAICKLFNVSMDELIGIKDSTKEIHNNKAFIKINKYFELFIKGIKMFYSMTFKQKIKCLFEMGFYFVILLLMFMGLQEIVFRILVNLLSILPNNILYPLLKVFEGITILVFFIICVYILVKLYRIRYLDYYTDDNKEVVIEANKSDNIKIKEEKIIIRDSENNFHLFSVIKSFIKVIGKLLSLLVSIPLSIIFVVILSIIIFLLCFLNKGIILIYVIIGLIGLLIMAYIFLEIFIRFIFNSDIKFNRILLLFFISLIIIGVSAGLFFTEFSKYKIIYNRELKEKDSEYVVNMSNNLILMDLWHYNTEILYEDRDDILIEFYVSNNDLVNINEDSYESVESKYHIISYWMESNYNNYSLNDFIKLFLDSIENKEINIYDDNFKTIVHISKNNYDIIQKNKRNLYENNYE